MMLHTHTLSVPSRIPLQVRMISFRMRSAANFINAAHRSDVLPAAEPIRPPQELRTRRLRVRRRRLLREQRRGEKQRRSQIGSDESSSSSSSSLGTKSVVDLTTARPSVGTAYDVARRHSSPKNAKSREGPQAEPIRNDATDIADNQQTRAPAKGRKYGVDRTNTQIPEPSEDRTGTTHDANTNITHNDQLEKK
ncbi:hypothetical protein Tcan_09156 [Toxocara canis]|uniref:Uncharacterized protein n=1 Tax=Toxocara canis TaxID=6265 RepID=A0A0B2UYA7_TOXCA|nr:hypothetical protein Tcan_09156 [Toxocara canis]